ncbi:hypothetical protein [Rufibacter latericius]|uniref:TonB-dependent receptor plug domain-containing protein n=1 Tax=Rufibacter latericius TaxID=2487040 RepID=A0A3M9MN30_9BACT|nr:hypothetical protein [Rufibacter latericius]RNI26901.1 hypothetical protein EFB08_10520 [Rufibacter latericius]
MRKPLLILFISLLHIASFAQTTQTHQKKTSSKKTGHKSSPLDAFKGKKPLILLDGRPTPQDSLKHYVNEEDVESVELIENTKKNRKYLSMTYGIAAKDGVIKVETDLSKATKRKTLFLSLVEHVNAFEKSPSEYLFVKDGILVDAKDVIRLKELPPSVLISIDSLKLNAAVKEIYGDAARENTILITTHNQGY